MKITTEDTEFTEKEAEYCTPFERESVTFPFSKGGLRGIFGVSKIEIATPIVNYAFLSVSSPCPLCLCGAILRRHTRSEGKKG